MATGHEDPHQVALPLAAPSRRLAAWLVDVLLAAVVFLPLSAAVSSSHRPSIAAWGVAVLVWLACLVLFDGSARGATPGKRLLGIRAVDLTSHGSIGYRRALTRRLVFFLGGLAFYAGWLSLLSDPLKRAWHDKAAGSVVIMASWRGQHDEHV